MRTSKRRRITSEYAAGEAWLNLIKEEDPDAARIRLVDLLGPPLELTSTDEPDPVRAAKWKLRDPKDEPIIYGAIQANCSHLLTADADCFGPYFGRLLDGVMVLKPGKFLALHGV